MENIVILDWDDTLFPTTWASSTDINSSGCSDGAKELFLPLDGILNNMIMKLIDHCKVVIVSNGSKSWIDSCLNHLPVFRELVNIDLIEVVSARDLFEDKFYKDYKMWKIQAFKICLAKHVLGGGPVKQIISVGDSPHEHEALLDLQGWIDREKAKASDRIKDGLLKSIIFKRGPELNEIIDQLNRLETMLEHILFEPNNMTIKIFDQ